MTLKPWYKLATPREDLREGKPLDAAEFAVHLDQVRDGRAPSDYQKPEQFFERTYLTQTLTEFSAEVVRRLTGERTETSAVFNMATQFGGGKTHALTLLYHLARNGPRAQAWSGVSGILEKSGVRSIPEASTAVFVGTEFDSLTGRGGNDGTPLRRTPWGEIAFQLGGEESFAVVAEHEMQFIEPKGDVIRAFLPKDRPCLILMDEVINYVSTYRKKGYNNALYNFIQALSETARGQDNVVLVVSIPASELEYTSEDENDEQRFKKMLDRLGKPVVMSAEAETSEIIRRRLFEWHGLPDDARETAAENADWLLEHRNQIPEWFPVDSARETFAATFPFHPSVLSVFERKWQALPRFQRTRGVLRLLALWVSKAYQAGYKGAHRDPLIGLGTAPLDDPLFRTALIEQLGESHLEASVTTDICGKKDSHAIRLDQEATEAIKKARLHRKIATTIFFESNGGQMKAEATIPEIRLAVGEPGLDIGNIETCLESLAEACYFLTVERNRYHFSLKENLNKRFADRRASIQPPKIGERVREEIQKVFGAGPRMERAWFPQQSNQVLDRPVLTLAVLAPEHSMDDKTKTLRFVEGMTRECGASGRTYKSALIWCASESYGTIHDEARKVLAWEDIEDEKDELHLDDSQKRQLDQNLGKARRDLKESVWRTYKNLALLGKDNQLRTIDLGLVNSSQADSLVSFILTRLRQDGEVEPSPSPNFLVRNWPPAFKEWSTESVRDAFFASPRFPRLLEPDAAKGTIARGVEAGLLAYVGKASGGDYEPFVYGSGLDPANVEISDGMYIVTKETADEYKKRKEKPPVLTSLAVSPSQVQIEPAKKQAFLVVGVDQYGHEVATGKLEWKASGGTITDDGVYTAGTDEGNFLVMAAAGAVSGSATVTIAPKGKILPPTPPPPPARGILRWTGEVPPQKWMNFYTKVLSKFAAGKGLKLQVSFEVDSEQAVSAQKIEETRSSLQDMGLNTDIHTG
jgi:Protein of unknown function (DUF499)